MSEYDPIASDPTGKCKCIGSIKKKAADRSGTSEGPQPLRYTFTGGGVCETNVSQHFIAKCNSDHHHCKNDRLSSFYSFDAETEPI